MRIILVGPVYPYRGGIAHFTEATAHALKERGHDVTALTFTRQYPRRLFPGRSQLESRPPVRPVPSVRLIDSINPLSWFRAAQHIMREAPDVVLFQQWMPFFAPAFGTIARLLRAQGIRCLAVVHNALPHERRLGDTALSRYLFNACDGFVALSRMVANDLRRLTSYRVPMQQVAHPPYHQFGDALDAAEARHRLNLPGDAQVLLFFGFVRAYKGLDVLLEALPHIREYLPKVHLVIAGEFYEDEEPYRELIRTQGLTDYVVLHAHYIPTESVPTYFSAADVVVQPYRSATQSGVAQVAFHFEKPVITTDVGELAAEVPDEEAGFVVPPEDPAELAAAVVRFFQEGWADRLEDGVRRTRQRHGWDEVATAVERLVR